MDEFVAILRARELVKRALITSIPAQIEGYLGAVGDCSLRMEADLAPDEAGYSVKIGAKHFIVVSARDLPERQRFTACHELGHFVLDLPSEHDRGPSWSYSKRPPNEIYCDVFAAELLLPYTLFKPVVDVSVVGFSALDKIANEFQASVTATGSRFAAASDMPCAFVISEGGVVRYVSRSKTLRDAGAWIAPGTALPIGSPSETAPTHPQSESIEVAADTWFSDWKRGGVLLEEARHLARWDQTLTLLCFGDDEIPSNSAAHSDAEEDLGLKELDGHLPWPGKRRRR